PFEAPRVHDAGDHHLDAADAADPGHRDEDPMPGEQLHDQTLDPRGASVGPPLDDDVADLTHLVPSVVEDRQAANPGDEDRGRGGRHAADYPSADLISCPPTGSGALGSLGQTAGVAD